MKWRFRRMADRLFQIKKNRPSDFLLMLAAVALATGLLLPLRTSLSAQIISLLYLLPVMLSAARWGLLPALGASLLSFFAFNYFFLSPTYTFLVSNTEELLALMVFLIVAVLISQAVGAANLHAAQARERESEAATLYNLTRILGAQSGLEETLSSTAQSITEAFGLAGCEIVYRAEENAPPAQTSWRAPATEAGGPERPRGRTVEIPLTAHLKPLGAIRLETQTPDSRISPTTLRLVNTFAAQAGLFIERTILARAAGRAHLLEESDRLKSALLSSVSHDLRTPLSAIKASATVLLQEDLALEPAARSDLLSAINEETDRLNHLVGDLLDMSRIEAGALLLKRDWCDLDELIRGVVRRYAAQLDGFRVRMNWPPDLPLVMADYVQVDRVVTNLLENAIRYTPPGSEIRIEAHADAAEMTVAVANQGPAIPERLQTHLFEKFYRISEDRSEDMGTGLGLSICKGIVEAHGGRIRLESPVESGAGARFSFTMPLAAAPPSHPAADEVENG
jgi:two-component system sensor histidine kinase KdpD